MSPTVPATPGADARPPIVSREPAPPAGTVGPPPYPLLRPTVVPRPTIRPVLWRDELAERGYRLDHPYVRRFWTAAIGPGAVADLLRLAVAARRGRSLLRPLHLSVLVAEGLVRRDPEGYAVRATVPALPPERVRRLHPSLRREHAGLRTRGGTLRGRWNPTSPTPSRP